MTTSHSDNPSRVWAVIGSSPSRPLFFPAAVAAADVTVTTNDGINEFLGSIDRHLFPDYYLLNDHVAAELYARYADTARVVGQTRVVTPDRNITAVRHHGVLEPDDILRVRWDLGETPFRRGDTVQVRASGLYCLQMAVNRGATTVLMLGLEGYASKPGEIVADNCGGLLGHAKQAERTAEHIAPFTQSVIEACPDVRFVFCGKPHKVLSPDPHEVTRRWPNLTVCRTPRDLRDWLDHTQDTTP